MADLTKSPAANGDDQVFRFLDLPKELRLMVYERLPEKHLQTLPLPGVFAMCANSAPELSNLLQTCKLVNSEAGDLLKVDRKLSLVRRECVLAITTSKEDKVAVAILVASMIEVLQTAHLYDNTYLAKLPVDAKMPTDIDYFTLTIPLHIKPNVLTAEFKDLFREMVLQIRRSKRIDIRWYISNANAPCYSYCSKNNFWIAVSFVSENAHKAVDLGMVIISADLETQRQVQNRMPYGRTWGNNVVWEVMPEEEWQTTM